MLYPAELRDPVQTYHATSYANVAHASNAESIGSGHEKTHQAEVGGCMRAAEVTDHFGHGDKVSNSLRPVPTSCSSLGDSCKLCEYTSQSRSRRG
jgi:predicted transcriptional regulator